MIPANDQPLMKATSEIAPTDQTILSIPFVDAASPTALRLPEGLNEDSWREVGLALARSQGALMWWIGDWWAYGEHHYGDRKALVEADVWEGPAFQTCMHAAVVCRRFQTCSREQVLSFRAHQAIAPIPEEAARLEVLAWAARERPTIIQIEERVREIKAYLAQGWTTSQLDRKKAAERGECVVANMREENGQPIDGALLAWAEAQDCFIRIDRQTEWGNPFEIPDDGDRAQVIDKFTQFYLPNKNGLLARIPTLRGKVLGCWCHPEECHGHIIAEVVNREAAGEGTVIDLTNQLAQEYGR